MTPEDHDRLLSQRSSCRAFLPKRVSRDIIEAILKTAQRTASWNNVQPWQVVVLSGAARDRLSRALLERAQAGAAAAPHYPFPDRYEGVFQQRRRDCGFRLYDAVGVARGDKAAYAKQTLRNFSFFDAPHVAILTCEEALGVYGVLDCGAYLTNFMNAAQIHGIATIAQAALSVNAELIHAQLELPEARRVVCGVSFGYADRDHRANRYRVPRAELEEVVTWREV